MTSVTAVSSVIDGSCDSNPSSYGIGNHSDYANSTEAFPSQSQNYGFKREDDACHISIKDEPFSEGSISDVRKLRSKPASLDLVSSLSFYESVRSISSNPDWDTKVEWQTSEQLTRMGDEEPNLKNGGERKFNVLCVVCGDKASGRHYGAVSCEGCKGFFKRSIRKELGYACRGNHDCGVTKHHRNNCQYCRLQKCLTMGMSADLVQSQRKPRSRMKTPLITFSSQKIFVNKDIRSPVAALPTFSSKKGTRGNPKVDNTDLNSLANVVTSFVAIEKDSNYQSYCDISPVNGDANNRLLMKDSSAIFEGFDSTFKVAGCCSDQLSLPVKLENDCLFEFNVPLLLECHVAFHLTTPNPGTSYLDAQYICESGSRLLFLSVNWAKSIPAFQLLQSDVQAALVRSCWSELFTLGLAQCSQAISVETILTAISSHLQSSVQQDSLSATKAKQMTDHILKLQDFVNSMLRLQVDDCEFAYLKAIVLFSPDHPSLTNERQIEKFQEKAYQELRSYTGQTESIDRFPKLLLRLPALRSLQPSITEELFFSGLNGNVQIDSIIPFILSMDSCEYTPEMNQEK